MNNQAVRIISHCPRLMNEAGHVHEYARSLERVCNLLRWDHVVLMPRASEISCASANWKKILPNPQNKIILKPIYLIKHLWALRCLEKRETILPQNEPTTFFLLEAFTILDLIIFGLYFILSRKKRTSGIALILRNELNLAGSSKYAHQLFLRLVEKILGSRVILFSDSESLVAVFSKQLQRKLVTLPIPLLSRNQEHRRCNKIEYSASDPLRLWFAGPPRKEKGIDEIKKIIQSYDGPFNIEFKVAQTAEIRTPPSKRVKLVSLHDPLTSADYETALVNTDIMLLPYDSATYANATSGVFVESVVSGVMPFVSKNTWMAAEAMRSDVKELILDWSSGDCLARACALASDKDIRARFSIMSEKYRKYHCEAAYAEVFSAAIVKSLGTLV